MAAAPDRSFSGRRRGCHTAQMPGSVGPEQASPVLDAPRIEFALQDGTHLAYQVAGAGPPDIVFVGGSWPPGWPGRIPPRPRAPGRSPASRRPDDVRPMGDRALGPLQSVRRAEPDGPGRRFRRRDRRGGDHRSRPLRDPQRRRGRRPLRRDGTRCASWSCATHGPACNGLTTSRSGSAIASSTESKSATGPSGGRDASTTSSPRVDDDAPPGTSSWHRPARTSS